MEKRNVTIQLPLVTVKWLKEHLISSPITTIMEDELQKAILVLILSSAIGGNNG